METQRREWDMKEALNLAFVESENHHCERVLVCLLCERFMSMWLTVFSHRLLFSWKNRVSEIKVCVSKKNTVQSNQEK